MKNKRSTNKAIMKKYSQGSREEIEKKKNDKKNVPVLIVTYFVVFIFIGMMAHLIKYVIMDSDSDIANSYNKRQNLYAETVIKGQIISDEDKESLYRQRRSAKAMIRLIDDQIGETLDVLRERGMLDDTLIVFTSDHGDMLGDHFMIQKGVPWKQSVGIPLAVRLPGAAPVGENTAPVEISDIAATVLDYAGLDAQRVLSRSWPAYNDIIPSRSLLPVLRGEQERVRDFCFSESDFTEERIDGVSITSTPYWRGADGCRSNAWQTIITENSKYIKYLGYKLDEMPYEEFYDLKRDPQERENRIADETYREQIEQARRRLSYMVDHYPPAQKTWTTACAANRQTAKD